MSVLWWAGSGAGWGQATRAAAVCARVPGAVVARGGMQFSEPTRWWQVPMIVADLSRQTATPEVVPSVLVWDADGPPPEGPWATVHVWRHNRQLQAADLRIAVDWPTPQGLHDCWPIVAVDRDTRCDCPERHDHIDAPSIAFAPGIERHQRLAPLAPHLARTASLTGHPGANLWAEAHWFGVPELDWLEPLNDEQAARVAAGVPKHAERRRNGADVAAALIVALADVKAKKPKKPKKDKS